jgi:hypothetical protein
VAESVVAEPSEAEPAESVPPDTPLSEISDPVIHRLPYSPTDSLEPWCAEYQPVGTIGTDNYGVLAYDPGYDLASYDLPFPDIAEQAIGGIPEYL